MDVEPGPEPRLLALPVETIIRILESCVLEDLVACISVSACPLRIRVSFRAHSGSDLQTHKRYHRVS